MNPVGSAQGPLNTQNLDPVAQDFLTRFKTAQDPQEKAHWLEMFKQASGYRAQSPLVDAGGAAASMMPQTALPMAAMQAMGRPTVGNAGAAALAAVPAMGALGKISRFNVDAKALSMNEAERLVQSAANMGADLTGQAGARFGSEIKNILRNVYTKSIEDPATKFSVQDILDMASGVITKGKLKRALAQFMNNPEAEILSKGRVFPLNKAGARSWIEGTPVE